MKPQSGEVADPKVFGEPDRPTVGRRRTAGWLPTGLMAAAVIVAVVQIGWFVLRTPPPLAAPARPFQPDPSPRLEITVTPAELAVIAPTGLTWRQLFQHYDLGDAQLAASIRQNLGEEISGADLAAVADQPVPTSRDIVVVLQP